MQLRDSRRLTGPNLLLPGPGAVLDVALRGDEADALVQAWRERLRLMLGRVGWADARTAERRYAGGVSLAFSAPPDVLYAATEVNEWAWEAAQAALAGSPAPDVDAGAHALARRIEAQSRPRLRALRDAAKRHGVAFLCDDDLTSVGLGRGVRCWSTDALPDPETVDWGAIHDVPVVLVTGTNGKSTTVRLAAAIVERAGRVPGLSSTDWIRVGDDVLDTGDYSGPGGARRVLRDPRCDVAILETARGGMLRRGLGVERADAAAILNVGEDHLGEWGVDDLAALVDVKFIVARAIDASGRLVLNADDDAVLERGRRTDVPRLWFSLRADHPELRAHAKRGGDFACLESETLVLARAGAREALIAESDIPVTYGGRARFNTSNALAAAALTVCAGIPTSAISAGLRAFESTPALNPGRGNLFEIDGVTVFADFAHNPHGLRALLQMAGAFGAGRTLVLLGQAGDRTDAEVRALVEATWAARPDRVVVKAMPEHLRGRGEGEMTALIDRELRRVGAPADRIAHAASELEGVQDALAWARPGDLLLLLLHAQRGAVLALLQSRAATSGRP